LKKKKQSSCLKKSEFTL